MVLEKIVYRNGREKDSVQRYTITTNTNFQDKVNSSENDENMFENNNNFKIIAAARRSADPGVIELSVMMPPPPSLDSILLICQRNNVLHKDSWMRHDPESIRRGGSSSLSLL